MRVTKITHLGRPRSHEFQFRHISALQIGQDYIIKTIRVRECKTNLQQFFNEVSREEVCAILVRSAHN